MPTHENTGFWYPDDAAKGAKSGSGIYHAILWYGRHAPLTSAQAAALLRLEEEELYARARDGALVALPLDQESVVFPAWQFDPRRPGQVIAGLCEILALAPTDPWGVADLLTHRQPRLDDRVPISALRGGADRGRRRLSSAEALLRSIEIVRAAYE